MAHAKLGPSGASRWMSCPASIRMEDGFQDKGSEYARIGTLAHEYAEHLLTGGTKPPPADLDAKMLELVREYIDYVGALPGDKHYEIRVKLNDDIWGTADCIVFHENTLSVIDLKTGSGVRVEAADNPQLKLYGLMAAKMFSAVYDFETVVLHIVQPALGVFDTWELPFSELLAWEEEVLSAAALALSDDAPFNPSEKACLFCKAKHACRARAEHNTRTLAGEFEPIDTLSEDELTELLKVAAEREKFYASVQAHALKEAEKGHQWRGFKLVEGRSNRKYRDPEAVAKRLAENGIDEALIYEKSLVGITDMEKRIGKKVFAAVLADLVFKPRGKPALVPESDPRPQIEKGSSVEDFESVIQE